MPDASDSNPAKSTPPLGGVRFDEDIEIRADKPLPDMDIGLSLIHI